jgi:hypothetical protein
MEAGGGAMLCKCIRHRLLVRAMLSDARITHVAPRLLHSRRW